MADVRASLDLLAGHPGIDAGRLGALGICQGVNWIVEAATQDDRIGRIGLVAGHYLTPATAEFYLGGADAVAARLGNARAAKERFDATGEVEYIPIVSEDHPNALLSPPPIRQWYTRWEDRGPAWRFHGQWENRITRMSELDIWGHDVTPIVENLGQPTLMVHADHAASGPDIPRAVFARIAGAEKELVWLEDRVQFQFYEEPQTIDLTVSQLAPWFTS